MLIPWASFVKNYSYNCITVADLVFVYFDKYVAVFTYFGENYTLGFFMWKREAGCSRPIY